MIFVDYDLMLKKCEKCTSKKFDETACLKGEDIFFCTKTEKRFESEVCLCCFSDFQIENVDYAKYFIYALITDKN